MTTRDNRRDVVVVGAGISGLTTAWHLYRGGADVLLLERGDVVGGAMQTERRDGFLLEKGPFNVIVRDPSFEELLTGLDDRVQVVTAAEEANNRYLYRHEQIMTVPTGLVPLMKSPLLSTGGKLRAARGLFVSARGTQRECTIEQFATRRFGREVSDTMVSAVVAGIMAGDIRKLSAYACFPVLEEFDKGSVSPLGRTFRRIPTMIRKRFNPNLRRKWKGLVSIDEGLGGLAKAIAADLERSVQTDCTVTGIERQGDGFRLQCDTAGGQSVHETRHLVLATPCQTTADLIHPLVPKAADILQDIESASLVVINLAYRQEDVGHPLDGFGFLVPHNEPDFPLMGVLWADSAFPHHAPDDQRLLRVFMGGSRTPDVLARSHDELLATARQALGEVLDVRGEPTLVDICPWPDALPQFYLGHRERIAEVREAIERDQPGLDLIGNYLDGVSINDCVKLGKRVAQDVLSQLKKE